VQRQEDKQRLERIRAQRRVGGRYLPGGKPQTNNLRKASTADCLLQLQAGLRADWPLSFVQVRGCVAPRCRFTCHQRLIPARTTTQVFEDAPGSLVISFNRELAAQEGDVTAYMNQHHRTNITVQAFSLVKSAAQWGMLTPHTSAGVASGQPCGVFYVYWPPWAPRVRATLPDHLAGPKPSAELKRDTNWYAGRSTRDPFGQRTATGLLVNWNVNAGSQLAMR